MPQRYKKYKDKSQIWQKIFVLLSSGRTCIAFKLSHTALLHYKKPIEMKQGVLVRYCDAYLLIKTVINAHFDFYSHSDSMQ